MVVSFERTMSYISGSARLKLCAVIGGNKCNDVRFASLHSDDFSNSVLACLQSLCARELTDIVTAKLSMDARARLCNNSLRTSQSTFVISRDGLGDRFTKTLISTVVEIFPVPWVRMETCCSLKTKRVIGSYIFASLAVCVPTVASVS